MRILAALVALAAILVPSVAHATLYVQFGAAPGGTGTLANPYNTIAAAIVAAPAGETIQVGLGTYNERINFSGKNITIRSSNPDSPAVVAGTVIDGLGLGTVVTFATSETAAAVLEGFTITGGQWSTAGVSTGGGIQILNSSPTIRKNVITNNATESDGGGICVFGNSAPLITNNTISDNSASWWGGGIYSSGEVADEGGAVISTANPTISNNVITGNYADWDGGGVAFFETSTGLVANNVIANNSSGEVGGGLYLGSVSGVTVQNNTIAANSAQGDDMGTLVRNGRGGGIGSLNSANCVVNSCIIYNNSSETGEGAQISLEGGASLTVKYSDVLAGQAGVYLSVAPAAPSAITWGAGNLDTLPLFSPTTGDYHLLSRVGRFDVASGTWVQDAQSSPLLDVGDPALAFANEVGPNGGRINMGAFGNTSQASLSGVPLVLVAAYDYDWTYQNTAVTTGDRHRVTLDLAVTSDPNGNTAYDYTVTKVSGAADITIQQDAVDPSLWYLIGGRIGAGPAGSATVVASAVGQNGFGGGVGGMTVTVRMLGDIDGAGGVSGQDKLQINKRLNGLVPDGREYDLDGLGGSNGQDKLILNKLLNGIALP